MKKIFARVGMYLALTDEEWEQWKEKYYHEEDLSKEDCERILRDGCLFAYSDHCTDSYIPDSVFEEPEYYEVEETK